MLKDWTVNIGVNLCLIFWWCVSFISIYLR